MSVRLNINGTDVGFINELPVSINKSVADIKDPGKRNSGYSKTIVIPGSKEANILFEFIFQVNVESNNFNPNVKTPASYYVNEIQVFKGDLQLLAINKTYNGLQEQVEYECSIVGENGNLFSDISGLYLTDIDLDDLDHPFTYASGLFNPTLGTGYCYPYIDYGLQGSRASNEWIFEHLKPAVFEKEYIDRIFSDAGYTYTSSYLGSTYAKSIIIPDVNAGALQVPTSTIVNNQFYAGVTGFNNNPVSLGYAGSNNWTNDFAEAMPFDNDSTGDYYDPGGVYNTSTSIFTPGINGTFNLFADAQLNVDINVPAGAVTAIGTYSIKLKIQKSTNSGSSWSDVGTAYVGSETNNNSWPKTYNMNAFVPPTMINQPCIFRVVIQMFSMVIGFQDGSSAYVNSGTASYDFDYTGTFGAVLSTANLPSGQTVVMNNTIPKDVTQLDFLTSIIKLENLYFEPDKDNPRNYIIEPREDFIEDTDPKDWSDKIDYSKGIKVRPMGELDVKRYIFTYKSDKDHYNKLYEEEFKEVYGTEVVDVDSDFVRGEKRIEVAFSATPIASASDVTSSSPVDIVAARLFSSNGSLSEVSPMRCNIRRLYWGGMIDCGRHTLVTSGYKDPTSGTGFTTGATFADPQPSQYPFAGHVDHPMDPTVDLCWDNPLNLYWIFPQQTYTNNQRYGARWSKFISEITDRDSKIVTAYFYLTERDIYEFSFRKKIFFDGTYYFVNEIKDYDPNDEKSIPVELLKLQTGPTFTPMSIGNINDILGGGGSGMESARTGANMNMRGNYGMGTSIGYNNINNDPNALVIGNNNNVG